MTSIFHILREKRILGRMPLVEKPSIKEHRMRSIPRS
jgi:hypothetical protein